MVMVTIIMVMEVEEAVGVALIGGTDETLLLIITTLVIFADC